MSDDLANDWGTSLLCVRLKELKKKHIESGLCQKAQKHAFFRQVKCDTKEEFRAIKVSPIGSDANLYAITCSTDGSFEGCLIAAGSYVSGGFSPLQSWSTSEFSDNYGISIITPPTKDTMSDFTKRQTMPLPYHIHGTVETDGLVKYKDDCLDHLHVRCLLQKMKSRQINTLLMEITLAGNGATLSDRALCRIGRLAKHHGFKIIVDEIMTGGRTGTLLLTQQKPEEFVREVAYVTMGKWLSCGLVLAAKNEAIALEKKSEDQIFRGYSTDLECDIIFSLWKEAKGEFGKAASRRSSVLKKLKVTEQQSWGEGVHIFAPVKRTDHARGQKNRFLPMISNTPIDVPVEKCPAFEKSIINEAIVSGCRSWLDPTLYLNESTGEMEHHRLMVGLLGQCKLRVYCVSSKWIRDNIISDHIGRDDHIFKKTCELMYQAGVAHKDRRGRKRERLWFLHPEKILFPKKPRVVSP